MENKDFTGIAFRNQNPNFETFYKSVVGTMELLVTESKLYVCNNAVSSLVWEYLYAIDNEDHKNKLIEQLTELNNEINFDTELQKITKQNQMGVDIGLSYTKIYYKYFKKIIKLLGYFLIGLTNTLLPNIYLARKKFAFNNNHYFYITYANFKQLIGQNLNNFNIKQFRKPINSIMVFYYGYKSYVTKNQREIFEKVIDKMIEFVSEDSFLRLLMKEQKNSKDIQDLGLIRHSLYNSILLLYSKINEEHSLYDLNPKLINKIHIDKTNI